MERKSFILNKLMMGGFLGYFVILLIERIVSIIVSIGGGDFPLVNRGWYSIFSFVFATVSVVVGIIFLAKPFTHLIKHIFNKVDDYSISEDMKGLIIAETSLLFSGMVQVSYNGIAFLQFVAYAGLILAIIAKCIDVVYKGMDKFEAIISAIYVSIFAFCLPVIHTYAFTNSTVEVLFYVSEILAVVVIVPMWGYMLKKYFDEGKSHFPLWELLVIEILCGLVVGFGWIVSPNIFSVIFMVLTLACYLIAIAKLKAKD